MSGLIADKRVPEASIKLMMEAKQLQHQSVRLCAVHTALSRTLAVSCLKKTP